MRLGISLSITLHLAPLLFFALIETQLPAALAGGGASDTSTLYLVVPFTPAAPNANAVQSTIPSAPAIDAAADTVVLQEDEAENVSDPFPQSKTAEVVDASDALPVSPPKRSATLPEPVLATPEKETAKPQETPLPAAGDDVAEQQTAKASVSPNELASNGLLQTAALPAQATLSDAALQDYAQELALWLERHKRYPEKARRRQLEGLAILELHVDGTGQITQHRLLQSTGAPLLDEEVLALVKRAALLPAPADQVARTYQIPIVFSLR